MFPHTYYQVFSSERSFNFLVGYNENCSQKTPPVSPSCPVWQSPEEPNLVPLSGAVDTGKHSPARDKANGTTDYFFSYFEKPSG